MKRRRKNNPTSLLVLLLLVLLIAVSSLCLTQEQLRKLVGPFLVACIIIGIFSGLVVGILSIPDVKGKFGERRVARMLKGIQKKKGGYIINDVIIPGDEGHTSQIDHILFTTSGIFVIETKNYAGRIYGKDAQREWTQVLKYGKVKNKLYNPVMQNRTHTYRLAQLMNLNIDIYSCVVFVRGNVEYINSDYVFDLPSLRKFIRKNTNFNNYSRMTIDNFYNKINEYKLHPIQTKEEHVAEVKKAQKAFQDRKCPRCGAPLVRKTDPKTHRRFWACRNYPKKCGYVRK